MFNILFVFSILLGSRIAIATWELKEEVLFESAHALISPIQMHPKGHLIFNSFENHFVRKGAIHAVDLNGTELLNLPTLSQLGMTHPLLLPGGNFVSIDRGIDQNIALFLNSEFQLFKEIKLPPLNFFQPILLADNRWIVPLSNTEEEGRLELAIFSPTNVPLGTWTFSGKAFRSPFPTKQSGLILSDGFIGKPTKFYFIDANGATTATLTLSSESCAIIGELSNGNYLFGCEGGVDKKKGELFTVKNNGDIAAKMVLDGKYNAILKRGMINQDGTFVVVGYSQSGGLIYKFSDNGELLHKALISGVINNITGVFEDGTLGIETSEKDGRYFVTIDKQFNIVGKVLLTDRDPHRPEISSSVMAPTLKKDGQEAMVLVVNNGKEASVKLVDRSARLLAASKTYPKYFFKRGLLQNASTVLVAGGDTGGQQGSNQVKGSVFRFILK